VEREIVQPLRCEPRHSWLPLLVPASAQRIRVTDEALRVTLADAGAEFVDVDADLEIAPARQIRSTAPHALVPLGRAAEPALEQWPRAVRGARRACVFALVWASSKIAAATLRQRGFASVRIHRWDVERPAGGGSFPLGAVVAADRGAREFSLLEAVHAEVGETQPATPARISSWGIVAVGEDSVLRLAVGPGRRLLETQAHALAFLRGSSVRPQIDHLVPWLRAEGRTGLAVWSREHRLPGSPVAREIPDAVRDDCIDLLAALHELQGQPRSGTFVEAVAAVAPHTGELETRVQRLGEELESTLADVARTFAHGDVSPANLLVHDGRLSGVVDWNKAGADRAPLHDLLNLRLAVEMHRTGSSFGRGFADWLLPLLRSGGDDAIRSYCSRVGLEPTRPLLTALASAYWLDRVAGQIRTYADRTRRAGWLRENVIRPAAAIVSG
jgi:hypothetical protein